MFRNRRYVVVCITIFLAIAPIAAGRNGVGRTTLAEQQLMNAVHAGKNIDLSNLSDSQRTIGSEFLKHLMFETPESQVPGKQVYIKGAIIELFVLENARALSKPVPFEFVFDSCTFGNFECKDCHFRRGLRFVRGTFGNGQVQGELDLDGAQIDENFEIDGTSNVLASLIGARVAGSVGVYMPASTSLVATNLKTDRVHVEVSAPGTALLDGAKADSMMLGTSGNTLSAVDLHDAIVDSLLVVDRGPSRIDASRLTAKTAMFSGIFWVSKTCDASCVQSTMLNLTHSTIERGLTVTIRADTLNADNLVVKESGIFNVNVRTANLDYSVFNDLEWRVYPDATPDIQGVSFRTLSVSEGNSQRSSVGETVNFLRRADSISAFAAFQNQLKTIGENAEAETAYVAMREKMREREWKHWFGWPFGVIDLFQQYVMGFGHSPVAPLLWSLAFVIFGAFAFRRKNHMEPRVESPSDFSGSWYSLELFLPIVDLGVAKEWRPRSDSKWRVVYARAHQMAGWVLIPVALAAITGVVK